MENTPRDHRSLNETHSFCKDCDGNGEISDMLFDGREATYPCTTCTKVAP